MRISLFTVVLASASWASGVYPTKIQSELGLAAEPACTLCHAGIPGPGTAKTLFVNSAKAKGLTGGGASTRYCENRQ
jgi:hypothetical protein